MQNIVLRSLLIALGSVAVSLLVSVTAVPALGGVIDETALLMCIICPLLIAWPASFLALSQKAKLHSAHHALEKAHRELAAAHLKLGERARRDSMTGMLNRESFFDAADKARVEHETSSLLLVGADHFKTINDKHGHKVGDEALVELTGAICRAAGKDGTVGRVGGEEFGVILPGASDAKAKKIGERICRMVAQLSFKTPEGVRVPLTVSVGVAAGPAFKPIAELIREADRRLHEAKRGGRNRVVHKAQLSRVA